MKFEDLQVLVLGNKRKKNITVDMLDECQVKYTLYNNPDWLYNDAHYIHHDQSRAINTSRTGQFRCFKGHQTLLKKNVTEDSPEYILMFEDDIKLKPDAKWKEMAVELIPLLDQFEFVGMCNWSVFAEQKFKFSHYEMLEPHGPAGPGGLKWWNGCCALLFNKATARKLIEYPYNGVPFDIWLCNYARACCPIETQQPFIHCGENSLVAGGA